MPLIEQIGKNREEILNNPTPDNWGFYRWNCWKEIFVDTIEANTRLSGIVKEYTEIEDLTEFFKLSRASDKDKLYNLYSMSGLDLFCMYFDITKLITSFRSETPFEEVKSSKRHGKPRYTTNYDISTGLDEFAYCRLEGFINATPYEFNLKSGINKRYGKFNHIHNFTEILENYDGFIAPCDALDHSDGSAEQLGLWDWVYYFYYTYSQNDTIKKRVDNVFPNYSKLFQSVDFKKNTSDFKENRARKISRIEYNLDFRVSFKDFVDKLLKDPLITFCIYPPPSLEIQVKDGFFPQEITETKIIRNNEIDSYVTSMHDTYVTNGCIQIKPSV